jgi:large subunit ribosomal protein L25
MKHPILIAETRKILGKKVKQLRREGFLPANVYGKGLASKAVQVKLSDFQAVFKEVGATGVVDLKVGDSKHPVLVKNLQMDYFANLPLHADFYQVNLKEKVKSMVPVELTGEARAVKEKIGVLLQTISEVEVEALPDRIPEHIEVNVEALVEIGAGITVGDLKAEEGVEILTDAGVTIARIAEPAKEEPVEVPAEAAVETEAAAGGEVASESGSKTGEGKIVEKK